MTAQSKIINSSAIPAWSGFIYQGKIALYHSIDLIINRSSDASYLKVETLDDFAIYSTSGKIISLHQVKAMKANSRSKYESALKQAAEVNTPDCDALTCRWFHVSTELNDMSSRTAVASNNEFEVEFYRYHDQKKFVELDSIDDFLKIKIREFLNINKYTVSDQLVDYKLAKLQMLLAAKVNLAHHRNQKEGMNKFEAADSIPIYFDEIIEYLCSEAISEDDETAVLFNFRDTLLKRTDLVIESLQKNSKHYLNGLCQTRYFIANMKIKSLARLYYSKKPNQSKISLSGFSDNTVDDYLRIILKVVGVKLIKDLPHYYNENNGNYLPTAMKFDELNQELDISQVQDNVSELLGNQTVKDILFEYENLVVYMDSPSFRLNDEFSSNGKFTDINSQENNRITKINNVRFISLKDAGEELND